MLVLHQTDSIKCIYSSRVLSKQVLRWPLLIGFRLFPDMSAFGNQKCRLRYICVFQMTMIIKKVMNRFEWWVSQYCLPGLSTNTVKRVKQCCYCRSCNAHVTYLHRRYNLNNNNIILVNWQPRCLRSMQSCTKMSSSYLQIFHISMSSQGKMYFNQFVIEIRFYL